MTSNPRRTRCKRRDDFAAFTTKLVLTLVSCLVVSMYTCYKVPFTKIKMLDLTDGGLSTNNHQNGYGLDTNFVFDLELDLQYKPICCHKPRIGGILQGKIRNTRSTCSL